MGEKKAAASPIVIEWCVRVQLPGCCDGIGLRPMHRVSIRSNRPQQPLRMPHLQSSACRYFTGKSSLRVYEYETVDDERVF